MTDVQEENLSTDETSGDVNHPEVESTEPTVPGGAETYSGGELRDLGAGESNGSQPQGMPDRVESVKAAATGATLTPEGQTSALQWFLAPDADVEAESNEKVLELNMGTAENENWIRWTIQSVDMETIRAIRKNATQSREARRTGEADEHRVNVQVLIKGTVDPPIMKALTQLANETQQEIDPVEYVKNRFKSKPGLIPQIAGEIMSLSGFDSDDVREADQILAAGNS